ncbi:c-type cytochrome biogenesis protein CcsB [Scrofimicrobium sp. R131]|uniref:c-type cytochrome biogenesis protein CcsB n=1 Tax=Scrofimicrobium appendicitidis TaxID=3079930 RepID=UPI0033060322
MDSILVVAEYILTAALVFVVLALVCDLVVVTTKRAKQPEKVAVGATVTSQVGTYERQKLPTGLALYATGFTFISFILTLAYLVIRMTQTGYGPFSNQHEFAVSFVLGILGAYLVAEYLWRVRILSLMVLPVAAALLLYSMTLDTTVQPLIPALQNNLLLTLHVGFAIAAYGAAAVSFGAAVLYLIYPNLKIRRLPPRDLFDDIGYKAATVTFPMLTIMIVLGAVWANTAWGRYWGWDPKETAALVTWLIYGAYLHARVTRGWQGKRSAWLLIIGFAAVLFAYFGNHFFGGLHSYA